MDMLFTNKSNYLKLFFISLLLIAFCSCKNKAEMWFREGDKKNANGDFYGAINDFNNGLEIDSNNIKCIIGRGISKSNLNDFAGAIEDYDLAIKINKTIGAAYFYKGFAKMMMGNHCWCVKI